MSLNNSHNLNLLLIIIGYIFNGKSYNYGVIIKVFKKDSMCNSDVAGTVQKQLRRQLSKRFDRWFNSL